ncbi:MAG: hypothetical protein IID44_04655 [Planctomycetes bacterium]|nr:hypothetical protein [Planctomycetota bacterium]
MDSDVPAGVRLNIQHRRRIRSVDDAQVGANERAADVDRRVHIDDDLFGHGATVGDHTDETQQ